MGRSIVVEVRKAVIEGIKDALNDPSMSVTYGWQGSDDERREQIYTNRPRATHDPASLKAGRNFRNERMEFDIVLLVIDPTKAPEDVDTRVVEIGQVVEEFLADHKSNELEIDGLNWIRATSFEIENRVMPTGSLTIAQWGVVYDARLT